MRIAYLTSVYARASDSFVRGEVLALRELGNEVSTFSVRQPAAAELVSDEIRAEYESTEYLLAAGPLALLAALLGWVVRRPLAVARCLRLCLRLGNPGLRGRLLPAAYLIEGALLGRRLADADIDHLHDHIAEGSAAVALIASTLSGVPFSFTVHGPEEFERVPSLALGDKVAAAAFVVAITEFARSQVYRWIDAGDWAKAHVVHCGVAPEFLAPVSSPPTGHRLVTIGRLVEQKGQLVLLEALAAARGEGAELELTIVGDGPLRGLLERRVEELGLGASVRLSGWLDGEQVGREIEAARALVLPSFAEGLPIVLMEAMARGRPVVATRVGGIAELVEPGVNGWLVAPGSVELFARALRELAAADDDSLARMGSAGAAAVASGHDRLQEARKLAALISGNVADSCDNGGHATPH
jgi:colanic acid/amylovoran biosynthesis glycosyltransferase